MLNPWNAQLARRYFKAHWLDHMAVNLISPGFLSLKNNAPDLRSPVLPQIESWCQEQHDIGQRSNRSTLEMTWKLRGLPCPSPGITAGQSWPLQRKSEWKITASGQTGMSENKQDAIMRLHQWYSRCFLAPSLTVFSPRPHSICPSYLSFPPLILLSLALSPSSCPFLILSI